MSSTDKKYELYKALQSTKWDELPNTYGEFQRKLNDKDFFNKSHSILTSSYPDLEESKLSRDEFYNFINSNPDYQSNIKYYSDEEPAYEEYKPFLQRSAETVGDIAKTGFNLFPAVQLFNLITGNYDDTIEAGKNIARIPLGAWKLARGIPGTLENWAIELAPGAYGSQSLELDPYATSEERIKHTEKVMELQKELDDPESSYNKTILNNIKEYADLRKRMKDQWIEAGVINKEETPAGQFFESFGFTAGILATAFVPGVGTPLAFGLGMSGEGMELAADVYEGTNGNLEATKKAFNIGTLLGTTEALTPLDAAIFAKKGITNLIKKDIMNGFKKEALKGFGLAGARQIGREFVGEGLQEGFQTWGEQLTKIDVGMQTKINWDEVFDSAFLGGLTGALMGGAAVGYNTVKEADNLRAYVNTELPKKLDEYVKYGLITPAERDRELLRFYNATSVQDIKQTIMSGTPIEANQDFKDKLRTIIKTQNLYKELKKAFDTPIDENHISKAMAIKDKALKDGVLLNDFDMFLLSHIESSGAKISEFDDPAIMHNYTTMLLNGIIQRTKEFDEVKGIIAQETGKTGEELTSLTHQTILNTDRFAKYREGYLNSLVAFTPHLEAIESTYKTDSFELSHNDLAEKEAVLHMKYFEMNNRQLEAFIRNRDNKLLYIKRKDSYRYSQAVAEFNRRMVKENEPKRYRYEFVRQGGRLVYKVIPFEKKVDDNGQIEMFQKGLSFDLKGTNVMPFNNPKAFEVTSAFDTWLLGLGNKLDISKPFNIREMTPYGRQLIEQFREEYLAKNNFTSIPKERIADFKKDWNTWLKSKFGLRHKEGRFGEQEDYEDLIATILSDNPTYLYGLNNIIKEKPKTSIIGSEVIISGDFLLIDMPHEYMIGDQEGAGLGWYIYSEVNGEPFIYEWQSDILPDLFGNSVSSTRKFKDANGNVTEVETLNSGEVRISDKDGTKYFKVYDRDYINSARIVDHVGETFHLAKDKVYNTDWAETQVYDLNGTPITKEEYDAALKEFEKLPYSKMLELGYEAATGKPWADNIITKQEFEAKKEELSKQSAEEGLKDFIEQPEFEDYLRAKAQDIVTYSDATLPIGQYNQEVEKVYQELLKKELSDKVSVLPALENLYKRYWNIWLMHSFIYAKERGHSTVWLPTGEAMYEIESSKKTAAMYATKWDIENEKTAYHPEDDPTNPNVSPNYESMRFDKVGPYWTALNKIKGIKLELSQPEWSTVPLIKADISGVATEAVTLFQKGETPKGIDFQEEQSSGYIERTRKNASADATIDFGLNQTGESWTKKAVDNNKKKYIGINTNNLTITPEMVNSIVESLNSVNAKTLNIAGMGIYNMKNNTQEQIDMFVYNLLKQVIKSPNLKTNIESIRTGGQTGFDEAGAKAGTRLGIPTMILAPKGWTFRDISGQDISDEQQFKARFISQIVQTTTPTEKVPPAASNEEIQPIMAKNEIDRLTAIGEVDLSIQPIVDWLSNMFGDIQIVYDETQQTPGAFKYNPKTNQKIIIVNPKHQSIKNNADLYRTIAHELIHNATYQLLKSDMIFRKQLGDLYSEIKKQIVGTTFYEENKDDLDRIFNDEQHELDEFLAYVISNTSALRGWMATTEFKPGTTWLKRFYGNIMAALMRLFGKAPKLSYLQALETLMNQTMFMPTTTIEPLGIPFYPQLTQERVEAADIIDKALSLNDEALGDVRSMTSFIDALDLDLDQSPYEYIQSISKEDFYTIVNRSKNLDAKMRIYYDKNFKQDMTFDEYKQAVSTYVYNNINSVRKRKTAVVTIDSTGVPTVKYYTETYKSSDGSLISPYHSLTMLDEIIPQLNTLFNTRFEVVYLEEVKDNSGWKPLVNKPHKLYFELNNSELQDIYSKVGVIFPGTFADKDTVIGLIEVDGQGNPIEEKDYSDPETTDIKQITDALLEMYRGRMQSLVESGKVTAEYMQEIDSPTVASITRLVMEDLKLGGKIVNGQLFSALFDPNYSDTYDAIKIFKRPYLVSPKYIAAQLPKEVSAIVNMVVRDTYNNDQDQSGIVVRNGKVYFRSIIFDDDLRDEQGNLVDHIVNIDGVDYNLTKMLINDYGTSTVDGGFLYGLGGFDVVYRYLTGAVKQGAIKLWGGNNYEGEFSAPFFLKTAGHGYSQEDNIIQWARANNISLIIPKSAVKVNRYKINGLLETSDGVFEIPMDNLYRLQEKDEVSELARGMQQTLTTNFMTYANNAFAKADDKKEFWNLAKQFANNLIGRFMDHTISIDKQGLLGYIKGVIEKPTNEYSKGLSQVLSNMLITYADERVKELSDEDKENKDIVKELLRDQRLSNVMLAEKISGLFYHPYFSKIFEDYMHKLLKELLFYDIPGSYSVLTPDIGWLAQTRIKEASDFALSLVKDNLTKEVKKLNESFKVLDEERSSIAGALESAVKEGKEELAIELNKRKDEILKEMDAIAEQIDEKESQIANGNRKEVQEARDKILYGWIDKESGRIKGDYIYYSENSAKEKNIKIGDTVITGFIPSDSAQSISGATVIALLGKKLSEVNKITGWSEYFQSQSGKDFDFDTALVMAYDEIFGSLTDFLKLAEIFRNTKNNYPAYIKGIMEKELGRKLSDKDIYNKEIRLKYMQLLSSVAKSPAVHNPLFNQSILNKYKKQIGVPVNKRKMATFKSLVGFKTKFVLYDNVFNIDGNRKNIDKTHMFHLIETNAAVDLPSDDTALKYALDAVREFDIENGTDLTSLITDAKSEVDLSVKSLMLPKYASMFKQIDQFLFGYGVKLSTKNNLDDFDEARTLYDSVKYIRMQNRINERLKTPEGKQALFDYFSKHVFKVKASADAKARMLKVAKMYIDNITIENMENSISMYIADRVDLTTLPNIKLEAGEYLAVEEKVAEELMEKYADVKKKNLGVLSEFKKLLDDVHEASKSFPDNKNARLNKILFLLTRDNEKLHILKGKILRVVNMFVQPEGLLVPQYNLTRFSKDLSVKADEEIFLDMFNAVLAKKRIVKPGTPYVSTTLNVKGKAMTVSFKNGKLLFEITGSNGQKISVYHDQIESLVKSGDPVGKAFQRYFSEAFGVREGKNRAAIAQMVDFSNTLDLIDRWKIAEDVIIPEIESLSDTEKRILFTSLLSYSPTVNESLYVGKEERSNDRHLTLLSLLRNDPVAVKFIEDYAVAFTQFVPHPDFTKAMDSVRTVRETDTDWEVWNMQSPGKKNLQKNLEDLRQEETNKPYVDPAIAVGKIVDLQNGNIIDLTLGDIGRIVEPYIPKVTTAKSDIDVISAAMKKHLEAVNKIDSFYKQTDIEITRMENLYLSRGNEKIKSFTKPQELNKLREEIEDLVTSNPDGITIAKNANGNYIYTYNSVQYSNLNDLLNVLGITDIREKTKYEIAMKWHILYSVENPIFIKSMVSYLQSVVFEFGRNSYAIQMVVSMQKRYEEFLNNISKRQFHYYPRVYRQHIFETKIMNYLKVQEAVRIQAEIDDALTYIADVQAYNSRPANKNSQRIIPNAITSLASHNGDSAWILGKAKDNVEKEKFNIGVGSFGKYINAFSLKRDLPDLIDGVKYYIRDSMLSHHRHQAQFIKMLKNDLLFVNWLSFQHKALLNNMDIKTIEAVKTEVATIGGNRMLLSRDLSAAEALPGMEISFFYINDRYYSGIVDRIDATYVYLKTDKQKYERYIKEQIKKYERVDTLIQSNPHLTAPTYAQLAVLQDLANQGYITVQEILAIQNAYEASTRIVNILKDILDDSANWGRFRKRDMFRKNASARGSAIGENGIYRYIEFGSIDYLKGIARELDNTFDGQLSEGGFGEIIKSGNLLPYLKYEMLKLPANIIDTGSKAIALMGLSTTAAAVKNIFDGMAGVIRDRGFRETAKIAFKVKSIGSEVKEKFKAGEVAYNQAILDTLINAGEVQFKEDKVKVAVEISKQFMLEQGLIFEDYLINSVAGNIEELFIEDEKNQTGYKTSEKLFNLYKTFKDSIGYKEHRDKIIELEKKLYDSIDPVESQRLMREIQFENVRWETVYNARMTELRNLVQKYTIKPVPIDLMKVNLAEMHNKTTSEIMVVLAKALPKSTAIQYMIGTKGFKRAEGHIRRMTAINYIYNAVLRGETDVDLIKLEAAKGIARTQALYDVMSRRLGDRTKLGRFALMFGQYPYYMKQIAKGTIKQAKEEGRNDLKVKLAKEWYRDTVMSGFSFFFQGLRLGSPINMTINGVLILLLQALKRMDDDKEPFDFADWDTKEVMFNLLQFKIGMGIGLALGTAYNAVTDQNSLISVGRIGKAYEVFYKTISDIFGLSEDVPKWQDKYATENWIRLVSRYTFGINPLFPSYSPDYTDEDLIEHYKTPIGQRWMDYWEPLIPLYPYVKYKTDF